MKTAILIIGIITITTLFAVVTAKKFVKWIKNTEKRTEEEWR